MTWDNFTYDEFACQCDHCDGENHMSESVIDDLQEIRTPCGFPFIITSGYRCPLHPIEAAKDAPGPHSTGRALDVLCSGENYLAILGAALLVNVGEEDWIWTGFGADQKGDYDDRYIHLDQCDAAPGRPRPHGWTY